MKGEEERGKRGGRRGEGKGKMRGERRRDGGKGGGEREGEGKGKRKGTGGEGGKGAPPPFANFWIRPWPCCIHMPSND